MSQAQAYCKSEVGCVSWSCVDILNNLRDPNRKIKHKEHPVSVNDALYKYESKDSDNIKLYVENDQCSSNCCISLWENLDILLFPNNQ